MPHSIAVSGKGGTGKTTLAALMVRRLVQAGVKPVLAVDADPNATLGLSLGMLPTRTLSDVREDTLESARDAAAVSKDELFEVGMFECLEEGNGFDLVTMGRPEGPKCYCYVNSVLKRQVNRLKEKYPVVVSDNEAGMEHISRLTTHDVDALVIVGEPTRLGILTAQRILGLARSLPTHVGRFVLVVNRVGGRGLSDRVRQLVTEAGFETHVELPYLEEIERLSEEGEPLTNLGEIPPGVDDVLIACAVPGFAPATGG